MADYTRREVSITRIEFSVDAPHVGSGEARYWHGLRDALDAVVRELGPEHARFDDAVRIEARDGEIVLSYEVSSAVETPPAPSPDREDSQ
jgi:hypothetical protein